LIGVYLQYSFEETIDTLLPSTGPIIMNTAVGVSNVPPLMVEEGAQRAFIFCNQVEYHPYKGPGQAPKAGEGDVLPAYGLEAHRPEAVLNDSILKEIG
jgi:hypothetical protein